MNSNIITMQRPGAATTSCAMSRRDALASLAAIAAVSIYARVVAAATPSPIDALIDEHRQAFEEWNAVIVNFDHDDSLDTAMLEAEARHEAAFDLLLRARPAGIQEAQRRMRHLVDIEIIEGIDYRDLEKLARSFYA